MKLLFPRPRIPVESGYQKNERAHDIYDVVVVGGGLAGLTAAHRLMLAHMKVLVLESDQTQMANTHPIANDPFTDRVTARHTELIQLAHQLNLPVSHDSRDGKAYFVHGRKVTSFEKSMPVSHWSHGIGRKSVISEWEKTLSLLDTTKPWEVQRAASLDQERVSTFLGKKYLLRGKASSLKYILELFLGRELGLVSVLEALFQIKSHHIRESLLKCGMESEPQVVIEGGLNMLHRKLAQEVNLLQGYQVKKVEQLDTHAVISGSGFQFNARKVILAMSPMEMKNIRFDPLLTNSRLALWNKIHPVKSLHYVATYHKPLLIKSDWNGNAYFDERHVIQKLSVANLSDGKTKVEGYALGSRAIPLSRQSNETNKEQVLHSFATVLGSDAFSPTQFVAEEIQGRSLRAPGAWTDHQDILSQPEGRIFWAGAESSNEFNGVPEGAVRSGLKVADEILQIPVVV